MKITITFFLMLCLFAFTGITSLNAQITSTLTTSFTGNGISNYTNSQYLNSSANAGDVYSAITTNIDETNNKRNFVGIPTSGGKYIVRIFTNQAININPIRFQNMLTVSK